MSALFPGGAMARRPLHFIWMLDCSGSMAGRKIQSLNAAIQEAIPQMREAAESNPGVEVLVRVITFSSGARWHLETPTRLSDFEWRNVNAEGHTDMGAALVLASEAMSTLPPRGVPPVLVLVTDGQPTDDFDIGLKTLLAEKWGDKAIRVSIAIRPDADLHVLRKFMSNPDLAPLDAHSSGALVELVSWVSTVMLGPNAPVAKASAAQLLSKPWVEDDSEVWSVAPRG